VDGTIVLAGRGEKGMYMVDALDGGNQDLPVNPIAMSSLSHPTSLEQWHHQLSHCSPTIIQEMASSGLVDGLNISDKTLRGKCDDCVLGRQTRRLFNDESDKVLDPLELVSFDLWRPSHMQSVGGKVYFMPIIDVGTSYKHGAYLSDASTIATIAAFDVFRAKGEALSGRKIQQLRTDRAYDSLAWEEYCHSHSILHEFSAPYLSAQNGLAEHAI
jgi:hypothetical protein